MINLTDRAFLRTDRSGKVAEVIDCKWDISRHCFPNWLAIFPRFSNRNHFKICFHAIGNLVQDNCAFSY